MRKDIGAKMSQKLPKISKKMKQKLVESGTKINLFGSIFGAQRYRNDSDNFSFFRHIYFSEA